MIAGRMVKSVLVFIGAKSKFAAEGAVLEGGEERVQLHQRRMWTIHVTGTPNRAGALLSTVR